MQFSIVTVDRPDGLEIRLANRPAHLAYLEANAARIIAAGPHLSADGQAMVGSLLLIEAADRAEAERFVAEDPFSKAGLPASVAITPWRRVYPKG